MEDSSHCVNFKFFTIVLFCLSLVSAHHVHEYDKHPLSTFNIYKTTLGFRDSVIITATPLILGYKVYNLYIQQ